MANKEWLALCGMYCGVCGVMIAHRDNNEKFKERLSTVYGCAPEDIVCEGCLSDVRFKYCDACPIKICNTEKNYQGCHECGDFPCDYIESFSYPVGKKVIMRSVPARRELGTEKWVEEEEKRYHCPQCGSALFRGSKRCRNCKEPVDQD